MLLEAGSFENSRPVTQETSWRSDVFRLSTILSLPYQALRPLAIANGIILKAFWILPISDTRVPNHPRKSTSCSCNRWNMIEPWVTASSISNCSHLYPWPGALWLRSRRVRLSDTGNVKAWGIFPDTSRVVRSYCRHKLQKANAKSKVF